MIHWEFASRPVRSLAWGMLAIISLHAGSAGAQERRPAGDPSPLDRSISLGELQPTPEMWMYQQELKLYQDPQFAVRKKAEFRARQRQARIAASEWFGYSKSRPLASATPFLDVYSPRWGSNGPNPNVWRGAGGPTVTVPTGRSYARW